MEVGFWQYLSKDGKDGGLLLKQRIPDVALFRGSRLQAWYYSSNQRGLLMQKQGQDVTPEALLQRLLGLAARHSENGEIGNYTPVGILRRSSKPAGEVGGQPRADAAPVAVVLTAADVTALLQRLPHDFGEAEEWSLQSLVEPAEDLRIVSVYSCDDFGEEKSDIYGRQYSSIYPIDGSMPQGQKSAADTCLDIAPARKSAVQSKTLSIVQYVSRFHGLHVNGLILEFVLDAANHIVLHGVWSVSCFDGSNGSRLLPAGTGEGFLPTPKGPPVALDPTGEQSMDLGGMSSAPCTPRNTSGSRPGSARSHYGEETQASTRAPSAHSREGHSTYDGHDGLGTMSMGDDELQILEDDAGDEEAYEAVEKFEAEGIPRRPGRTVRATSGSPQLLMEVWSGDRFMGETNLQLRQGPVPQRHCLQLQSVASTSRPDPRKGGRAVQVSGLVHAEVALVPDIARSSGPRLGKCPSSLRLTLFNIEGLRSSLADVIATRVLLWFAVPQAGGSYEFSPVWSSKEVHNVANPEFNEYADITIPHTIARTSSAGPQRPPGKPTDGSGPRRPTSAKARMSSDPEPTKEAFRQRPSSARPASARARSETTGSRPTSARSSRPGSAKARKSSSAKTLCGSLRPGSKKDLLGEESVGCERTPLLYQKQVMSRFSMESTSQSTMISVLARQLERYRDQIQVWMEQRLAAKAVVARSERELAKKQQKLAQLAEERDRMVEMYKQKLSGLYRGMSREQTKQQEANAKIQQEVAAANNTENDNRDYIEQLETRYAALRQTLDKTMTKLNEVQTSYTELQVESADYTAIHARYVEQAPELTRALNRIQTLAGEKEAIQQQTQETRGDLLRVQDELNRERSHALRLEHFIRKIAVGPPGARNHGGSAGYILDTKSKKEATALLKEASKLRSAAEASGYAGARDPLQP
eukprot:gnl/MRDRNA2_/MRDRNA2_95944_c0_seq1.p1 gnl/MRDRNA2_/MRDRNA2_95944_c0~~gnl/MRDRNA2_/MRDRNA2_95944_c0_seq1.p1  ORF type:complete len:925 (+),score=204.66 gnl/MRDRNA2_/MRDRNA2_95944_c0_seq1:108-2882(+)